MGGTTDEGSGVGGYVQSIPAPGTEGEPWGKTGSLVKLLLAGEGL